MTACRVVRPSQLRGALQTAKHGCVESVQTYTVLVALKREPFLNPE
jgi:hypothetical protein